VRAQPLSQRETFRADDAEQLAHSRLLCREHLAELGAKCCELRARRANAGATLGRRGVA
jgi:hypothetical protein